jgi:hypothetical protein
MSFDNIKSLYSDSESAYPSDWPKPNLDVITKIENKYGIKYPSDYIEFQLKYCHQIPMGDISWDGFGWANDSLASYLSLTSLAHDFFQCAENIRLAPFRIENGDFECFDGNEIVLWNHGISQIDNSVPRRNFIQWLQDSLSV